MGASTYLYITDRFGFGRVRSCIVLACLCELLTDGYYSRCAPDDRCRYTSVIQTFKPPHINLPIASCIAAVGFAIQASGPPFPAFVVSFLFSGYGITLLVSVSQIARLASKLTVVRPGRWVKLASCGPIRRYIRQDGNPARHLRCGCDVRPARLDTICYHETVALRVLCPHRPRLLQRHRADSGVQIPYRSGWVWSLATIQCLSFAHLGDYPRLSSRNRSRASRKDEGI